MNIYIYIYIYICISISLSLSLSYLLHPVGGTEKGGFALAVRLSVATKRGLLRSSTGYLHACVVFKLAIQLFVNRNPTSFIQVLLE